MQKLKCAHKNVAAAQHKKKKTKPKRASRHFVNIITTFFAIYLYYLRVCVSVWLRVCGVCWVFYYFCWLHDNKFAFKSPLPSPLPSPLSSRRLARSGFAFFCLLPGTFFQGCCCACGPLFGRPCRLCVCVCGYTHNIINHKVSHDFMLTPDPPPSWLAVLHLRLPDCNLLAFIFGGAALRDFQR